MTDNKELKIDGSDGIAFLDAQERLDDEILRILRGAPAPIRTMTTHLSRAPGKMIRGRALLACAMNKEAKISPDAVHAAASVELVHLATLVHDDIIDQADMRRGIKTLHTKFGERYAVLCGDFLLSTALELASDISVTSRYKNSPEKTPLPRYMSEVCLGELMQNQNLGNLSLTEKKYLKIIRGKTAALFEAAFYSGFMFSDDPEEAKEIYLEIGGNIGLIFQLADDAADYTMNSRETKKPVLSDYAKGVITLPLIYSLKSDQTLREKLSDGTMSPEELREAIITAGGLDYTYAKIKKLRRKTEALIRSLDICTEKRELLETLLIKACGEKAAAR